MKNAATAVGGGIASFFGKAKPMAEAVLDPIAEVERLRSQRESNIRTLAAKAAAGEIVSVVDLDAALSASNVTPRQYRELVQRMSHRRKLREAMNNREAAAALAATERHKLAELEAERTREIEAAHAKYQQASIPVCQAIDAANQQVTAAAEAERQLRDGAPEHLKQQKRENELRQNEWNNAHARQLRDLGEALARLREQLTNAQKAGDNEEAGRLNHRISNAQRDFDRLTAEQAEIREESNRLYQAMLTED